MPQSKTIKIFLASSLWELKNERKDISNDISGDISNLLSRDNIIVHFVKCENNHSGHDGTRDQAYYNQQLKESDFSVFLFKTHLGDRTKEEFDIARNLQKDKTKKHVIFVYFLQAPEKDKEQALIDFKEGLDIDYEECENLADAKYYLAIGLLQRLGIRVNIPQTIGGQSKEEHFKQYEDTCQKIHNDIDEMLKQIEQIKAAPPKSVAAMIMEVIGIYREADLWASKTDYDKEKYSHLLFDYAQFLYKYGMYYDAEAVWLRQIPLAEELCGKEHDKTAASYNNIGSLYWKQGNYPKALEYYGKSLAIKEKVLGKNHSSTATTYNNIGTVYDDQGDYPKALEYYRKAMAIREKVLGKDRPDTATTYNNIGVVYKEQGDYPKALEYYGKALAIHEKVLGTDHPVTATTYNNIGSVYWKQINYPKALEYYRKALAIREKALGTDHPDTATTYNNIGSVYYQQKKYPKAFEYLEKALKIRKAKLGNTHPDTIVTLGWMVHTKAAMG